MMGPSENLTMNSPTWMRRFFVAMVFIAAAAVGDFEVERSEEKLAEDLKECLARLAPLAGRSANGELMDRIFSRFCIGK